MVDLESLFKLNYGMYIISSIHQSRFNGCIVNTAFQVIPEPSMVAVSVNKENLTHEFITNSGLYSVSILAEDAAMKLIGKFGFRSGRDLDKFKDTPFKTGLTGTPVILQNTVGCVEIEVEKSVDVGTHTLFIGRVKECRVLDKEKYPMTYTYYRQVKHGKTPKSAATYIKEKRSQKG